MGRALLGKAPHRKRLGDGRPRAAPALPPPGMPAPPDAASFGSCDTVYQALALRTTPIWPAGGEAGLRAAACGFASALGRLVRATEPFVDPERHRRTAYQAVGGRLWNRPKATNATGRFGTWRSDIPIDLKMRLGAVVSARIARERPSPPLAPTRRPVTLAGGTSRSHRRSIVRSPRHAHSLVLIQTKPSKSRLTRMQA